MNCYIVIKNNIRCFKSALQQSLDFLFFVFGAFGSWRGPQPNHGTVQKSAISPQPGNQKRIKRSNSAYLNKRSFMFKIKFCVFQLTTT